MEKERAPSIADIVSESIAESIEIVDDDYNNKDKYVHDDNDSDRTIQNDSDDKLKVPKVISRMESIRRESQDTVIFAPKHKSGENQAPKSDGKAKLKKKLSFQDSFPSDTGYLNEDTSHGHKKKKKKKHKRSSKSETSTSDSIMTSKSDDIESLEQERKSKHSRREKDRRKNSKSRKSCWYCKHTCEYHRDKNMRHLFDKQVGSSRNMTDESIQAGPSCLPWTKGMNNRHYLFDPCADALYDNPRTKNFDPLDSCRYDSRSEAAKIAKLYLTTNPCQGTSSSFQQKESLIKNLKTGENSNPMAFALSELLRGQLDLTANFLASQKQMYATYCANLEMISNQNKTRNEISTKKLQRMEKIGEKDEEVENELIDDSISIKEDVAVEEYESEFEQDDSEDDNAPKEMETNL